jgi:putative transposase
MPRKNSIKIYVENGYYHIYNRGVEKRTIFEDTQDYKVFLSYLKYSLSPPPDKEKSLRNFTLQGLPFKGVPRLPKNFHKEIELIAFCLMPNHFHLLIKQLKKKSMQSFMTSIITRYSMYFNKRYDRVGRLFQGPYKAVLVKNEAYLLHLTRYIHSNPNDNYPNLEKAYSSYSDYLGISKTKWVNPRIVLSYFDEARSSLFKRVNTYKQFVEGYKIDSADILGKLTLE